MSALNSIPTLPGSRAPKLCISAGAPITGVSFAIVHGGGVYANTLQAVMLPGLPAVEGPEPGYVQPHKGDVKK